jgi:N12 class adenine-specific DNA methylase
LKGVHKRTSEIEKNHNDLQLELVEKYSTKEDVRNGFKYLGDRLDKLDEKLDRIAEKK